MFQVSERMNIDIDLHCFFQMTGLDHTSDSIMEIACIITSGDLDEIARHPSIIVKVPDSLLDGMDEWCTKHHGEV